MLLNRCRSTERWRQFYKQFEWALDYSLKPEDRPRTSIGELKALLDNFASEEEDD